MYGSIRAVCESDLISVTYEVTQKTILFPFLAVFPYQGVALSELSFQGFLPGRGELREDGGERGREPGFTMSENLSPTAE